MTPQEVYARGFKDGILYQKMILEYDYNYRTSEAQEKLQKKFFEKFLQDLKDNPPPRKNDIVDIRKELGNFIDDTGFSAEGIAEAIGVVPKTIRHYLDTGKALKRTERIFENFLLRCEKIDGKYTGVVEGIEKSGENYKI